MRNAEFLCAVRALVERTDSPPRFRIPHFAFRILMTRRRLKSRKSQPRATRETSAGGVVFRRGPDGQVRFLLIRDSDKNWGVPKGHLETGEPPAEAARREGTEETGLGDPGLHGPTQVIDWYFPFPGKPIPPYCHVFLFAPPPGAPVPPG